MKRIALGVAGVAVLGLCLMSGTVMRMVGFNKNGNSGRGNNEIPITLATQADGSCKAEDPTTKGDYIGGKRYHILRWDVQNNCKGTQFVSFTNFRLRDASDPTKLGPQDKNVVSPDPADSDAIDAGKRDHVDTEMIRWLLGAWNDDLVFKYSICVGTTKHPTTNCTDPDLDVWPY